MSLERLRVEIAHERCPFCHEEVRREEPAKTACGACMAWHHAACADEHGACAACGAAVGMPGAVRPAEARADAAYGRLFAVFSRLATLLGVVAGCALGWTIGDADLAAALVLMGAVAGLIGSHLVARRVTGVAPPTDAAEAKAAGSPFLRRSGEALLGPWLQASAALGLALGLLVSRTVGGAAVGVSAGAALGLAAILVRAARTEPSPPPGVTSTRSHAVFAVLAVPDAAGPRGSGAAGPAPEEDRGPFRGRHRR